MNYDVEELYPVYDFYDDINKGRSTEGFDISQEEIAEYMAAKERFLPLLHQLQDKIEQEELKRSQEKSRGR